MTEIRQIKKAFRRLVSWGIAAWAGAGALVSAAAVAVPPAGYTRLLYIDSDANAYIKTSIAMDATTQVEMSFGNVTYTASTAFFGLNWTGNRYLFNQQSNKTYFHSGGQATTPGTFPNPGDNYVKVGSDNKCVVKWDSVNKVGGEPDSQTTAISRSVSGAPDLNLAIFGCNNNANKAKFRFYWMNVTTDAGAVKAKLVPCRRESDGALGLYDLQNEKFYTNSHSAGAFATDTTGLYNISQDGSTLMTLNYTSESADLVPSCMPQFIGPKRTFAKFVKNGAGRLKLNPHLFTEWGELPCNDLEIGGESFRYPYLEHRIMVTGRHLELNDGARLSFQLHDEGLSRFTFSGTFTLNGTTTIDLPKSIPAGTYPLITAASVVRGEGAKVVLAETAKFGTCGSTRTLNMTATGVELVVSDWTLPAGYTRLNSIWSTGAQYIDAGIAPTAETAVDLHFGDLTYGYCTTIFGQGWAGSRYLFNMQGGDYAHRKFMFHGAGTDIRTVFNEAASYRVLVGDDNYCYLRADGESDSQRNKVGISRAVGSGNLFIFSCGTDYQAAFRFDRMKMHIQGDLFRDFVPCINPKGEVGLFDLVYEKFYGNKGSQGPFLTERTPYAEIQLPWVENAGGALFDTGVNGDANTSVEMEFSNITSGNDTTIFGEDAWNSSKFLFIRQGDQLRYFGNPWVLVYDGVPAATDICRIKLDAAKNEITFAINGVTTNTITANHTVNCSNKNICFWGLNTGGYQGKCRIHWAKIWQGAVLVRDFVPWRDAQGRVGFYDRVSNSFFPNRGRGWLRAPYLITDRDATTVTVDEGTFDAATMGAQTNIVKTSGGILTVAAVGAVGSVDVRAGRLSLQNNLAEPFVVTDTFTLAGGTTLAFDMLASGCDTIQNENLVLTATAANPVRLVFSNNAPSLNGDLKYVLIAKGLQPGDEQKFTVPYPVRLSVEKGALVAQAINSTTIVTVDGATLQPGVTTLATWENPTVDYGQPKLEIDGTSPYEAELICEAKSMKLVVRTAQQAAAKPIKIFTVGDARVSHNGGYGKSWRIPLAQKLTLEGFNVKMTGPRTAYAAEPSGATTRAAWMHHLGISNTFRYRSCESGTIMGLLEGLETYAGAAEEPDFLILQMGTFEYWDKKGTGIDSYLHWKEAVDRFLAALPMTTIIVTTSETDAYSLSGRPFENKHRDIYNALIREQMAKSEEDGGFPEGRVLLVDVERLLDGCDRRSEMHQDNWQFNALGCDYLAEQFKTVIMTRATFAGRNGTPKIEKVRTSLDLSEKTLTVTFSKPIVAAPAEAAIEGGPALADPVLSEDGRAVTWTLASELTPKTDYTLTVGSVSDVAGLASGGESVVFQPRCYGALNNVPAEYTTGFTRLAVIEPKKNTYYAQDTAQLPYVWQAPLPRKGIEKAGYYIELVRADTGEMKTMWMDMVAPRNAGTASDADIGFDDITFPVTEAQYKQQTVKKLHVYTDFGNIANVPPSDDTVEGYIECNPINYGGTDANKDNALPEIWPNQCGWNDTMTTGSATGYGTFQFFRKYPTEPKREVPVDGLFMFNCFGNKTSRSDYNYIGFGLLADTGIFNDGNKSMDGTWVTGTGDPAALNAGAYKLMRIEIWAKYQPSTDRSDYADGAWTGGANDGSTFVTPGNWQDANGQPLTSVASKALIVPQNSGNPVFNYIGWDPVVNKGAMFFVDGPCTFNKVGAIYLKKFDLAATGRLVIDPTKATLRCVTAPTFAAGAKIALDTPFASHTRGRFLLMTWDVGTVECAGALTDLFDTTSANGANPRVWEEKVGDGGRLWLDLDADNLGPRVRVLPVGDSITHGSDGSYGNWRIPLMKKLCAAGYLPNSVGYRNDQSHDEAGATMPENWVWHSGISGRFLISNTGSKQGGVQDMIDAELDQAGNVDVLLMKIGTNDINGRSTPAETLFDAWTNTVQRILAQSACKVIAGAVVNNATAAKNEIVLAFNAMMKKAIEVDGIFPAGRVYYADLYNACPRYAQDGTTLIEHNFQNATDLHPDWPGEDLMAEEYCRVIKLALADGLPVHPAPHTTTGSLNNVPAEYRQGFKLARSIDLTTAGNLWGAVAVPYDDYSANEGAVENIARVGYYIELRRRNIDGAIDYGGHVRWLWVDMMSFGGRDIESVGIPLSGRGQGRVSALHVTGNVPFIETIPVTDDSQVGWVEFWPTSYTHDESGIAGAATGLTGTYDWNDTATTGNHGCMQVHHLLGEGSRLAAQTLFSYTGLTAYAHPVCQFGNYALHGNVSLDWTFVSRDSMAETATYDLGAYEVARMEIWTRSDAEELAQLGVTGFDWRPEDAESAVFSPSVASWRNHGNAQDTTPYPFYNKLALYFDDQSAVAFATNNEDAVAASLTFTGSHAFEIGGTGRLTVSDALTSSAGTVTISTPFSLGQTGGTLTMANAGEVVLTDIKDGANTVVKRGTGLLAMNDAGLSAAHDFRLEEGRVRLDGRNGLLSRFVNCVAGTGNTLVWRNTKLADVEGATAQMCGSYLNAAGGVPSTMYYWRPNDRENPTVATCQFQIWDGTYTKTVCATFRQLGADVYCANTRACYTQANVLGRDMSSGYSGQTQATSLGASGYGIHNILPVFKEGAGSASGDSAATLTIAAGAQLDVNLDHNNANVARCESTHGRVVYVAGNGPDGTGAVINSIASSAWGSTFGHVVLTGDTSFGLGYLTIREQAGSALAYGVGQAKLEGGYTLTTLPDANTGFVNTDFAIDRIHVLGKAEFAYKLTGTVTNGVWLANGATVAITGNGSTFSEGISFYIEDGATVTINVGGGAVELLGDLVVGEGATLNLNAGKQLVVSGQLINHGTINKTGGDQLLTNGKVSGEGNISATAGAIRLGGGADYTDFTGKISSTAAIRIGDSVYGTPSGAQLGSVTAFTSDLEFYAYDDHANTMWGNGAYDALVQKCADAKKTLYLYSRTATATNRLENSTWNACYIDMGNNTGYGVLAIGPGATINFKDRFWTGRNANNPLSTALIVEEGGVLNSTTGESSNRSMLIGTYPGGDAYTHEFVINGGTVSTPYGFIGVGWQATHASMTLNSGLVSAKGLMMRATTVGGDGNISTAHTEKMTQNGGTLEIGSLGIGGYAATKTPTLAFNAGTLKATAGFTNGYPVQTTFGETPETAGDFTIDLNGQTVNWTTALRGYGNVLLTGAGSFASGVAKDVEFQDFVAGNWTVGTNVTANLTGAAGFTGDLTVEEGANTTIRMGEGLVEFGVFDNRSLVYEEGLTTSKAYLGPYPFRTRSLAKLHRTYTSNSGPINNSHFCWRGQFYVDADHADTVWYFAGTFDDRLLLEIDGAVIFTTTGAGEIKAGQTAAALAEGWHSFRILAYDGTGSQGPTASGWNGKMALGWSTNAAAAGSTAVADYTKFDETTLRFRLPLVARWASKSGYSTLDSEPFGGTSSGVYTSLKFLRTQNSAELTAIAKGNKAAQLTGWFYAETAGDYAFTGCFDDWIALFIDGQKILKSPSGCGTATGTATLTAGWHAFDIRVSDNSGNVGTANSLVVKRPGESTAVNFDEGYFLMQAEMPGLLGTTTVAKGATLTNAAAEACPIFGTLAGDGNLAGKFAFGEQSTWAIGIRRARLTSCVDTTGVTNTDYLQLLRTIDVTVEELSTKAKYELGPAGDLTAEDAAKIAVTVTLDGADVPGWTATVEDGELKLVNPKPVLGSTILLR
ncbi:MAG: Ig-like domain-containing protein [Kiritimatiellae bacterium]|nr:Ig-like domain-containing protein [Kiritimatiellia bacterium]